MRDGLCRCTLLLFPRLPGCQRIAGLHHTQNMRPIFPLDSVLSWSSLQTATPKLPPQNCHLKPQEGKKADLPVYFGDAGSPAVLHAVGADKAACAVRRGDWDRLLLVWPYNSVISSPCLHLSSPGSLLPA